MREVASSLRKIGKYWRVFWKLKQLGFMSRAFYRFNFLLLILAVFCQVALSLIFIKVVFGFVDTIAGWSYEEILVVLASYMLIEGLIWVCFGQLRALDRMIQRGNLDNLLSKPIDTQFLVSVWEGDLEDISRLITGLGILFYALWRLSFGFFDLLFFLPLYFLTLTNAFIIFYNISLIVKTYIFWSIKGVALFQLTESLIQITRFPVDIFSNKLVRIFFTFLLPLAFVTTVPAKILTRPFEIQIFLESFLLAIIFTLLARKIWNYALSHYSSASS